MLKAGATQQAFFWFVEETWMMAASGLQQRVVSSAGQVGAELMEWVTQSPADTVGLFSTS